MQEKHDKMADTQFDKMTKTPVEKLITALAVPTVISMLVTSIYNMADTYFVSHIDTRASAAVGIVFPIMSIIQACGFTLGMGAGSLISVKLGQKKNEESSVILSTAFFAAILLGAVIAVLGNVFSSQFLSLIGASDAVLPYAKQYARYIFWGAPFMTASFVLNNVLRSEGKAFFSMIALTFGGVLNMILDPILIYGLNLGIGGAAIATLLSQFVSFCILFSWFLRRKTVSRVGFGFVARKIGVLAKVVWTGFPSLARQGLASVATITLNTTSASYGDEVVAAMSIATKILMFVASIMIGIGQGFSPVSGYNYGAKRFDRVKKAYFFMLYSGTGIMTFFSVLIFIFAKQILFFFIQDEQVVRIGIVALRWQVAFMPFHSLIVGTNMLMQSTRNIKSAIFLSMNRQGIYLIPAVLILPHFIGLTGVQISQFVADVLSALTAIPYVVFFFRKLDRMAKAAADEVAAVNLGQGQ